MNKERIKETWSVLPMVIMGLACGILAFLDIRLKNWSYQNLSGESSRVLIDGFLGLTYHENTGAAFGFLAGSDWSRWFLVIVKIVLIAGIIIYMRCLPTGKKYWLLHVPLMLIVAGGIGNLVDRLLLGSVRDMLEFLFIDFPIFNLADVYVVTGVISFLVFELFVVKHFAEDKKVKNEND